MSTEIAEPGASPDATDNNQGTTTMPATQNRIFSSGVLRLGLAGAVALATDGSTTVGQMQDISLDITFDRKEVNDAAQVSIFAVDTADAGGKAMVKISSPDLNRLLLPYLAGMTKTSAGAVDTFTLSATSKPQVCRLEIDALDSNGKNIKFVAQKAKGKGISIANKVQDFSGNSYEFDLYPDAAGNVATLAMDQ